MASFLLTFDLQEELLLLAHLGLSELKRVGLRVALSLLSLVVLPYPSLYDLEPALLRALLVLRWARWPLHLGIVVE